ncbi:MAG TPA: putative sulfate exporter family transporter [Candidatus Acidoferrales bacterium]|nr:putative sulfate exporter family transporter [Candidatus Acidoferrales bacterium]
MRVVSKVIFIVGFASCFTGLVSPPVALTAGIAFGLALTHPYAQESRRRTPLLLQASVVALGFGMNLQAVLKAGSSGLVYTAAGIVFAFALGLGLGKLLEVRGNSSFLITAGTAICGGSAIAAVAPILQADGEEMAVSLGSVFILNSVALLIFPPIGALLHMTQTQFGLWTALAIHDTSSVVGAASKYGEQALVIGTTVKLARALWIVPLALATAAVKRKEKNAEAGAASANGRTKIKWPWFILFFCVAAVINTYGPAAAHTHFLFTLGRLGLTATLFLIGSSISRATLKEVGWRPLLQGIVLWAVVGVSSLYLIRAGWIGL